MHGQWCGRKCSDCTERCRLDEEITCSPDCEALNEDGSRNVALCIASGCDACENKFGGSVKVFDTGRQYDVYEPWLRENGKTLEDLPLVGKNDVGENVIVSAKKDTDGAVIWITCTAQKNGWVRINRYFKNGTVEEEYQK